MSDALHNRSDRELQDALIAYLSDANLRRASPPALPLSAGQALRAGKFARFLARRYYRDRLARSFRFSRRFAPPAESLVDTPEFDAFLEDCVLGSLNAAERVGELAIAQLLPAAAPGVWWNDLLEYERLFFLQAATTEHADPAQPPTASASARCRNFTWRMPDLLRGLKAGALPADNLRGQTILLFSRSRHGRIYVAEVDESTAAVFRAAQVQLSPPEIAATALLPAATVRQVLAGLAHVGALSSSLE
jgi:hypothetical protein